MFVRTTKALLLLIALLTFCATALADAPAAPDDIIAAADEYAHSADPTLSLTDVSGILRAAYAIDVPASIAAMAELEQVTPEASAMFGELYGGCERLLVLEYAYTISSYVLPYQLYVVVGVQPDGALLLCDPLDTIKNRLYTVDWCEGLVYDLMLDQPLTAR